MASIGNQIPLLNLLDAGDPGKKAQLLSDLRSALFDIGFLYVTGHGVSRSVIENLTALLPNLFDLPPSEKSRLRKPNSPHFLGYSGFAEETTLGKQDLREQFDFATELPVVYTSRERPAGKNDGEDARSYTGEENEKFQRDFSKSYWRLRGPNQFPPDDLIPGFREAFTEYHDAVQALSYRFVHLVEEAFDIPRGTFDHFFGRHVTGGIKNASETARTFLPPQHRIKLLRYPPAKPEEGGGQGVGAHKDSSGWLTFLYQVGDEPGLEVMSAEGDWIPARPIDGSFVVNFGNAFEAATEGAVKATVHRVIAPGPESNVRYSIPFFQGLPLDMTVSEVQSYIPKAVRVMRRQETQKDDGISTFLDPRWDELGESQLRKWIRSHKDVGLKWYGPEAVAYYTATDPPPSKAIAA